MLLNITRFGKYHQEWYTEKLFISIFTIVFSNLGKNVSLWEFLLVKILDFIIMIWNFSINYTLRKKIWLNQRKWFFCTTFFDLISPYFNWLFQLMYSKEVIKLKWFIFYFWFVICNNFQKKLWISSFFQNINSILEKDKWRTK